MPTVTFDEIFGDCDGTVEGSGSTWAAAHSGSTLTAFPHGTASAGQLGAIQDGPSHFIMDRVFISFDATSLGSVTITGASIRVKASNATSPTHTMKFVQWTRAGATGSLATSDFSAIGSDCSSATSMASIIATGISGLLIPLNSTGIAQIHGSGSTPSRFAMRSQDDSNNTSPSGVGDFSDQILTFAASTGSPCELVVTYTTGTNPTFLSISPNNGHTQGGTAFTITGTGFVVGAAVSIGGVPCSGLVVVDSTTITGVTGAHPGVGAVDVFIQNSDGGSVTASGAFTYTAIAPTLISVSPASGSPSGGTLVTLTGSGFASGGSPPNSVHFGAVAATSVSVLSDSQITCLSPAGTGTVNVSVTNPNSAGTSTLVSAFTYVAGPPSYSGNGSQLIYDFTRRDWFTGQYGPLQMIATDPTQGAPKIYGLNYGNAGFGVGSSLFQIFNESVPGPQGFFDGQDRGFLQTMPLDFGNPRTQKKFSAVLLTVNDVTAVAATGLTAEPWTCFVYVDSVSSTPLFVPLIVNPTPYNVFPGGAIEGASVGELIGFLSTAQNGVCQGHTLYVNIYFPTGAPVNTPVSGDSGGPLNLPWAIYRIDVFASMIGESKGEP